MVCSPTKTGKLITDELDLVGISIADFDAGGGGDVFDGGSFGIFTDFVV